MKKIIICLLAAITLSNCEVKVKEAKAQSTKIAYNLRVTTESIEGMDFLIFYSGYESRAPYVINLTKEKLEIELLRKQLNSK